MTGTVAAAIASAAAGLKRAGCDEPRRYGRWLVAGVLGVSPAEALMLPDRVLDRCSVERIGRAVQRVVAGEPLSRVLGKREFWGLDFELTPETLDPRPETETVVEAVLARVDRMAPLSILDLGTGSGCLALALLSAMRMAEAVAVDRSAGAITTARRNARSLGFADRCRFFVGDWGSAVARRFDVIVANPPYIATPALRDLPLEVSRYDPRLALDGGEDGLGAYRAIASQLPRLAVPGGVVITEIGFGQTAQVKAILRNCGMYVEAVERDLAGIERCVVARSGRPARFTAAHRGEKSLGMPRHHD
jgi:release factor glutamine methyltransferase